MGTLEDLGITEYDVVVSGSVPRWSVRVTSCADRRLQLEAYGEPTSAGLSVRLDRAFPGNAFGGPALREALSSSRN